MLDKLNELKVSFEAKEWANPDWTDKVLGLLQDNEVAKDTNGKKFPRVRGLRRVGSFLSDINIVCDVICCDSQYAACKATGFLRSEEHKYFPVVSSTAEATPANVNNEMIAKHLLATSESRAEGRCWTKILKLNCLTAEEMSIGDDSKNEVGRDIDAEEESWCTDIQKKIINKKCKAMDMDIIKYAVRTCEKREMPKASHVKNGMISKVLAAAMIDGLDVATRKEENAPEELKGYQKGII